MGSKVFRKAALDRLSSSEQLDQLIHVTSPQGWTGLAVLTGLVVIAVLWGWFGSIPIELKGEGTLQPGDSLMASGFDKGNGEIEAVLVLPPDDGRTISAGMEARIFPADSQNEQAGFIPGKIRKVEPSTKGAMWTKVEVTLNPDSNMRNSELWTLSNGAILKLPSGTRVIGKIMVQRDRPLGLLIPGLRKTGGA